MCFTTTACTFSSLIWPDGSAPAALASLLFDPPEPQIIGRTQCFVTFLPFRAPVSSYFWLFLFSDLLSSALLFSLPLPISAFHLSILSKVWFLNFLRLLLLLLLSTPTPTTTYYYLLLTTTYYYLLLPTTTYYYLLLPTTTYYYLLLPTTTYYYLLPPTTTYYHLLPTTTDYYY